MLLVMTGTKIEMLPNMAASQFCKQLTRMFLVFKEKKAKLFT
jgi:hypothetical protein